MNEHIHLLNHPLIEHKLTILRDRETENKLFRETLNELSYLMVYEITRDLKLREEVIQTPLQECRGKVVAKRVVIVPILRAGLGMVEGILNLLPTARVGHIGLYRNEATLQPEEYYCKLPPRIEEAKVFLLDPMLATGGSISRAVELLQEKGARDIRVVSIVSAPEGLEYFQTRHPAIDVYTTAIDEKLNEKGYILPGLGDCGDRIFGTL